MKYVHHRQKIRAVVAGILITAFLAVPAYGEGTGSLLSVTEEAQILPVPDGSGNYLLKSDGFYCLNENGSLHDEAAVHFFSDFSIDGSVFEGYYYHEAGGKYRAGTPYMVHITDEAVGKTTSEEEEIQTLFDGYFMAGNLGKLSAAPQVRYLSDLELDKQKFEGFYFFNENGKLETEPGIYQVKMTCNGQMFDGYYYFGGPNGVLLTESGVTEDGFSVDENGKLQDLDQLGIENLEKQLETFLDTCEGEWSVYVKDLETEESFSIHNQEMYSASLIKAFVLAKSYEDLEQVQEDEAIKIKSTPDSDATVQKVDELMWNMITVSDNESFNELVRLQTESDDFNEGAENINEYLEEEGYADTSVQHTLAPSASKSEGIGDRNTTSVEDCGLLLERIYKGECVSEQASREMLELLLNQQVTAKIPEGIEDDVKIANKTGETDTSQHDMAIVYGDKTTYILCVMSEGAQADEAIENIRDISNMTYHYLNLFEYEE